VTSARHRVQETLWALLAGARPYQVISQQALHPRVLWYTAPQVPAQTFRRPQGTWAVLQQMTGRHGTTLPTADGAV